MAPPPLRNQLTDVEGLRVGCAVDTAARTGVTVVVCDTPMTAAVDVRGGGPGTRDTDVLNLGGLVDRVDAIVLSGGSVYGLAAADGVTSALGAQGRGVNLAPRPGVPGAPIVPAAILYDLANEGDKAWGETPPYARLGREALAAAQAEIPVGNAGAGYGALAGALKGGQGTASGQTSDGLTVGALVAVNSFGSVVMPDQAAFWAWPFEQGDEFGGVTPKAGVRTLEDWGLARLDPGARENTSLAVVACNADLTASEAHRLAVMAQDGLARAIRPAHAPFDGDVVFALASGAKPLPEPRALSVARLGGLAADVLARTVARGVYAAESLGAEVSWRDRFSR
ncbi:MAG: P1 family peptidase [Maricaulaceae bacterium]